MKEGSAGKQQQEEETTSYFINRNRPLQWGEVGRGGEVRDGGLGDNRGARPRADESRCDASVRWR